MTTDWNQEFSLPDGQPDYVVGVWVKKGERIPVHGMIVDFGIQRSTIRFEANDNTVLSLADLVLLRFMLGFGAAMPVIQGQVVERRDEPNGRVYQFLHTAGVEFHDKLPPGLLKSRYERRRVPRYKFEETLPCCLSNGQYGAQAEGLLFDVSELGVGLTVESEVDVVFPEAKDVRLSFTLPEETDPLQLVGSLTRRVLRGERVVYVMEFDLTEKTQAARLALRAFVGARCR